MDHPRIATIKHELSVQEDFRRMLCAVLAEPLDTAKVQELAMQLSAKWGLGANARADVAANAATTSETVDSTHLIEEIESLLATFDQPVAPNATAAAADTTGGDDTVPPCVGRAARTMPRRYCLLPAAIAGVFRAGGRPVDGSRTGRQGRRRRSPAREAACGQERGGHLGGRRHLSRRAELEHLGRHADLSAADLALGRFRREVERCLEYIPQLLATVAASNEEEKSTSD